MQKWLRKHREMLLLAPILALAAFLTCFQIWKEGDANTYYTAAVTSMLQSWHNFFFASFDPGGFISVDKPALGLWLQAASGLVFGVHGWSMILPEALCAVGSVAVLHRIVRRSFGAAAGLIAALALAVTPIFVAVARTNNLDSSLTLVMLLAAWAVLTAAEKGSLRHLLLAFALVGVGFNIKMLQAWMIFPALMVTYLATANAPVKKRLAHLAAGTAILLAVSLSWAVAVDLTPAANRPYVGGSSTNSVLRLAVDYNGIQRVLPNSTQGGGKSGGFQGMRGGGIGIQEGGTIGVFRLFNETMAGQASWLIPAALFGLLALAVTLRDRDKAKNAGRHLLLWALWMLPMMVYFSISGFFHRYYLAMLAPALAAPAGIGAVLMWRMYRQGGWRKALLPMSIVTSVVIQCIMLSRYNNTWGAVLSPVTCAFGTLGIAGLAISSALKGRKAVTVCTGAAAAAALLALLAAPAAWSVTPILYGSQTSLPFAGPELSSGGGMPQGRPQGGNPGGFQEAGGPPNGGSPQGQGTGDSALTEFLQSHSGGEKFLAAVPDANTAAPIILATGKPVMAVGGFLGTDNALTLDRLKQLVKDGELRYFLVGDRIQQHSDILQWVRQNGKEVPANQWSGASHGPRSEEILYDLAPESAENDTK